MCKHFKSTTITIFIVIFLIGFTISDKIDTASELIFDYVVHKQIKALVLFLCWPHYKMVSFAKRLMTKKFAINVVEANKTFVLKKIFKKEVQTYHQRVILDTNCAKSYEILKVRYLFTYFLD